MTAVPADRIPSHWLSGRPPAEPVDRTPLAQFVLLSMLVHGILISLFGAPAGGSSEGRAMWGSLSVSLPGFSREAEPGPPLRLRIAPKFATPPAPPAPAPPAPAPPQPAPVAKEAPPPPIEKPVETPAAEPAPAPRPIAVPQLLDRIVTPEAPKLAEPPPIRVPLPTEPVVIPQLIDRIATPERNLAVPPAFEVPPLKLAPAPPIPVPAPITPIAPTVIAQPIEAPPIPVPPPVPAPAIPTPLVPIAPTVIAQPIEVPPIPVPPPVPPPAIPTPLVPITPTVIAAPIEAPAIPVPPPTTPAVERSPTEPAINTDQRTAPSDFQSAPPPPTISDRAQPPARDLAPKVEAPLKSDVAPRAPGAPAPATPSFARPKPETFDPALPQLDADAIRRRAREIAREGTGNRAILPFPMPPQPARKSKEEIALEKARKPDCRTAYSNLGLLAVVPLIANEFGEGSCKW